MEEQRKDMFNTCRLDDAACKAIFARYDEMDAKREREYAMESEKQNKREDVEKSNAEMLALILSDDKKELMTPPLKCKGQRSVRQLPPVHWRT